MACRELTTADLLGLGLSPRTAYVYGRVWAKVEQALAELGVDWMTCRAADIGVIATTWPNSHSARSQLRASIRHAWEVLEREDRPSLRAVRVPQQKRMRCKAIEAEDAARLEGIAWDRHDLPGLAVLIGLYTALRRAEIARLRWEHFTVDKAGQLDWLTVQGKGDVTAEIPVHPTLKVALAEHRRPAGWVFPGRTGSDGPVCPATIWQWVRDVGVEAGVPVRTHLLRHTALAEANDRSGNLRAVQDLARHSRPETTAGYTRTTSARLRAVVELIDYGRGAA